MNDLRHAGPGALPSNVIRGNHWSLNVLAIAAATFAMVTSEFLPIGLLNEMACSMDISTGRAGWLVSVPGWVAAIAAPILTVAIGNRDRKHALVGLTGLIAVADIMVAAANSFIVMLAGRALLGMAVAAFWAFSAQAARRVVPPEQGNRAAAIVLAGISLGTVVGMPLGAALGAAFGWRNAFLAIALLACAVLVAQWRLLPRLRPETPVRFVELLAVTRAGRLRLGWGATALVAAGQFTAYTYFEPFLTTTAEAGGQALSVQLGAYGLAGLLGTLVGERLAARDVTNSFALVALSIGAALALMTVWSDRPATLDILILMWGTAFGAVPVYIQLWMHDAAPDALELTSAITVSVFQFALSVGAYVGGQAVDLYGVHGAFRAAAGLTMAAGLLIALHPEARAGRTRPSNPQD